MKCTGKRSSCGGGGGGAAKHASVRVPPAPWRALSQSRRRRWTPIPTEEPLTAALIATVARAQGCGTCVGDVTRVDLTCRKLTGGQPRDTFRDFVRLYTVLADGNLLALEDLLGLPALRDLSLRANRLDHIPPYRGPDEWFTNLEMLDISSNPDLPFKHLTILGHLRKLKYLAIRNCKLSRLPRALWLPTLLELDASSNPFGGQGSRVLLVLSRQPELRRLRLRDCGLRSLPVLLTIADATMLDDYSWGDENEPEGDTKVCQCWCHTTEYQRAPHELAEVCGCWRCRLGAPCAACACRQRLSAGRARCSRQDPAVVRWARSPRGRRAARLVHQLEQLAAGAAERLRARNWTGDCDRGRPGRLFGVPMFAVPHEPFPRLAELGVCGNPLARAAGLLAASTWPRLARLHVAGTPLADCCAQLEAVNLLLGDVVSLLPEGETTSSMAMQGMLEEYELDWLPVPEEKREGEGVQEEEEVVGLEDIEEDEEVEGEEALSGSAELQGGAEAEEEEEAAGRSASVEFGAWRSSSSSTPVEEPRPLTAEERWQQRAIRHLRRHWDAVWVTRRPRPPPPGPRPVCQPGEPCLRRRPPPPPVPPTPVPEPLATCEAGGPCKRTLRRILWKMAWGRLQHPPPLELLRPQVEKQLAGRDLASLFFCDEERPARCSCCPSAADEPSGSRHRSVSADIRFVENPSAIHAQM